MAYTANDVQLTTSASFALGSGPTTCVITKCTVCNTDASPHTVTVYRVPQGGSAGATNELVSAQSIAAGTTMLLPISGHTLPTGWTIQALASAGSVVNLSISGSTT